MAYNPILNPFTGKLQLVIDPLEAIAHADLSDMPDVGGTNTDHDARYLKLDQTTPQTVANGAPLFTSGLKIQANSQKLYFGAGDDASITFDGANGIYDTGSTNVLIGNGTFGVGSSTSSVVIGQHAGSASLTANSSVFIGANAGKSVTSGQTNTFIGSNTGTLITDGGNNMFFGYGAGINAPSGSANNVCLGKDAGKVAAGGCAYIGTSTAGQVTGTYNTAIGFRSMLCTGAMTGVGNVAIGPFTLADVTGASNQNTAVGYEAGQDVTTGDENCYFGYEAGNTSTTGSRNLCLGYQSDVPAVGTNDYFNIANSVDPDYITGTFGTDLNINVDLKLPQDNLKLSFGATDDVEMYYDNTKFVIDDTTTQKINFADNSLTTTGTISGGTLTDGTATLTGGNLSTTAGTLDLSINGNVIDFSGGAYSTAIGRTIDTDGLIIRAGASTTGGPSLQFWGASSALPSLVYITSGDNGDATGSDGYTTIGHRTSGGLTETMRLDASNDVSIPNGDLTVTATIQGGTLTDGTATLTGGNLTGMGNITGTDIDVSAGTGSWLGTGTGTFGVAASAYVQLGAVGSWAGFFDDGTQSVKLADGTYAIDATGWVRATNGNTQAYLADGSYGIFATSSAATYAAGYFLYGANSVTIASASYALQSSYPITCGNIVSTEAGANTLSIISTTTRQASLELQRGTTSDGYTDWQLLNSAHLNFQGKTTGAYSTRAQLSWGATESNFTLYNGSFIVDHDSVGVRLGEGQDVETYFDGSDWIFQRNAVTADVEVLFQGFDRVVISQTDSASGKEAFNIDQDDADEPFVRYDGSAGNMDISNIVSANGTGSVVGPKANGGADTTYFTYAGSIRVNINGTDYWMPYYQGTYSLPPP